MRLTHPRSYSIIPIPYIHKLRFSVAGMGGYICIVTALLHGRFTRSRGSRKLGLYICETTFYHLPATI